jgi:hypothetical protein
LFQSPSGVPVNQMKALMSHGEVTRKDATFNLDILRYCDFI